MIIHYIKTHPWQTALVIAAAFLLTLALVYPATLHLFRIKFNYANGQTLMQFRRVPNILARIFFYSKPTTVLFIGNGRHWHTYKQMKAMDKVTGRRKVNFLYSHELRELIEYKRRTVNKHRAA